MQTKLAFVAATLAMANCVLATPEVNQQEGPRLDRRQMGFGGFGCGPIGYGGWGGCYGAGMGGYGGWGGAGYGGWGGAGMGCW